MGVHILNDLVNIQPINLTGASSHKYLNVGETAIVTFSALTDITIPVITDASTGLYEVVIVGNNIAGIATNFAAVSLVPPFGGTSWSWYRQYQYVNTAQVEMALSTGNGSCYLCAGAVFQGIITVSTRTESKSSVANMFVKDNGNIGRYTCRHFSSDITTAWGNFGTLTTTTANYSGVITVKRLC